MESRDDNPEPGASLWGPTRRSSVPPDALVLPKQSIRSEDKEGLEQLEVNRYLRAKGNLADSISPCGLKGSPGHRGVGALTTLYLETTHSAWKPGRRPLESSGILLERVPLIYSARGPQHLSECGEYGMTETLSTR